MASTSAFSCGSSARRGGRVSAVPRPMMCSQSLMHWTRSGRASRCSSGMNHSYSGIASRLGETKPGLTFAREGVRHARNPADGTRGDAFDDDVVEAGEQDKTIADHVAGVDETPRVAGGILEAD